MPGINCLIIEDEPLAARVVADYVEQMPGLRLAGICEDVRSAVAKLGEEKIDLLLLDINLPRMNGIEFIKTLPYKCHVILTTAYHEFALTGFELDVADYLLKPIAYDRFVKAVNKVVEYERLLAQNAGSAAEKDHLFVKSDGRMVKVMYDDLLYIESVQNYVLLHTSTKKIITYSTLKNLELLLPDSRFVKVQKSFVVAIGRITAMRGADLFIGDTAISISRKLKEEIKKKILDSGRRDIL